MGWWVLEMVERTQDRKIMLLENQRSNAIPLVMLVLEHVSLGNTIYVDGWNS